MLLDGLKTYRFIKSALASSRWPTEKLQRLQEDRLRELLFHAYRRVPLYRKLYDENGFQPEEFRSLKDLEKIPILRKSHLKAARPEEVVAKGIDPNRCQSVNTSGSTGMPLRIYLGPAEERWQRAVAWRILFEHGFHWTDRTLEIRMTFGRSFFVQKLGIAPKDWLSILESPEAWARCFSEKKHRVIVASASTLHALSEAVEALNLKTIPPRIIVSDSETLSPATRHVIQQVLGTDPVDVFGLVEVSNFAWQCEERRGFHVSCDSHIVEVAAPHGEQGSLIVTDLGMWVMPIIRYDSDDLAKFDPTPCPCGRSLTVLGHIYGRAVDSVILPSGSRLFWPFFHEILGGYNQLRQWRIIQSDIGQIKVQLVLPDHNISLLDRIKSHLSSALPKEIKLNVERVETIPITPGQKVRMVISRVSDSASKDPEIGV